MQAMNTRYDRVLLKVGYTCNNNCVFCHSAPHRGTDSGIDQLAAKIRLAASLGAKMLVLSGGEPTIRPDLMDIAGLVNAGGLALGLVTNGRMLAYRGFAAELLQRHRLDYLYVSLSGPDASLHDRHCRQKAYLQVVRGLELVQGKIRELTVNVVVTAWNLHRLVEFLPLAAGLGPLRLKFSMLEPEGNALDDFEGLVPRLREAAEAVRAALDRATREHPAVGLAVDGFPLCLIPDHQGLEAGLREDGFFAMSEAFETSWHPVDDRHKTFGERCAGCSLRRRCRGVYSQYLLRRGEEELRPVSRPVPNSFNFVPCGSPERLDLRSCDIRAGLRPPPDPVRGFLLQTRPGRFQRYETRTRDFSDETIRHAVAELGQVYRDRKQKLLVTNFPQQLVRHSLAPTCRRCPFREDCGGVRRPDPEPPFEHAGQILSALLGSLEGSVLDVGCGLAPYTPALQPALQEGRLRYVGIDPHVLPPDDPRPGCLLIRTSLEAFQWEGPPFEAVLALRSLNHLESAQEGIGKLAGLVAPGGRLLIAEDVVFGTIRTREKMEEVSAHAELPFEHQVNLSLQEAAQMVSQSTLRVVASHSADQTRSTLWIVVAEKPLTCRHAPES